MVFASGILIINTVKRISGKVSSAVSSGQQNIMHNPLTITFALLVGLILCVLLMLVSFAIGSIVASFVDDYKAVWHFFNCLGVLIFVVIILFLFYPMFIDTEQLVNQFEKSHPTKQQTELMSTSPTCMSPSFSDTGLIGSSM